MKVENTLQSCICRLAKVLCNERYGLGTVNPDSFLRFKMLQIYYLIQFIWFKYFKLVSLNLVFNLEICLNNVKSIIDSHGTLLLQVHWDLAFGLDALNKEMISYAFEGINRIMP